MVLVVFFGQTVWKSRLMNTATASRNTAVRQMTEISVTKMSQQKKWPKWLSEKKQVLDVTIAQLCVMQWVTVASQWKKFVRCCKMNKAHCFLNARRSVCRCKSTMSNPRASCGPVDCFVRLGLGFCCSKVSYVLTTCPCFDNVELDIFDAGGPQCHIVTSVTIAVRIRTLSGH